MDYNIRSIGQKPALNYEWEVTFMASLCRLEHHKEDHILCMKTLKSIYS